MKTKLKPPLEQGDKAKKSSLHSQLEDKNRCKITAKADDANRNKYGAIVRFIYIYKSNY